MGIVDDKIRNNYTHTETHTQEENPELLLLASNSQLLLRLSCRSLFPSKKNRHPHCAPTFIRVYSEQRRTFNNNYP